MEQLSFSKKPNDKLFFLGALGGGIVKMGSITQTSRTIRLATSRPNIPLKISAGNMQQ